MIGRQILIASFLLLTALGHWSCNLEDTPNRNLYFQAVVDIEEEDATALLGVERPDGSYHILYKQITYKIKSVIIEKDLTIGKISPIDIDNFTIDKVIDSKDGGFLVFGSNIAPRTAGRVIKINADQSIGFDTPIGFSDVSDAETILFDAILQNDQYLVCGSSFDGNETVSGYAILNLQGEIIENKKIFYQALFVPYRLSLNFNNQFVFLGRSDEVQPFKRIIAIKSFFGDYETIDIHHTEAEELRVLNEYICLASISTNSLYKIDANRQITSIKLSNSIHPDAHLENFLASKSDNLLAFGFYNARPEFWLAEFSEESIDESYLWNKTFKVPEGSIRQISTTQTSDGYLITANYIDLSGKLHLFLVKTDENGNTE